MEQSMLRTDRGLLNSEAVHEMCRRMLRIHGQKCA